MTFQPYLFFGGNCREAFTRYQEIFGGELHVMTMGDVPGEDVPADKADLVIHASVMLSDTLLMGSDDPMTEAFGPVQGMMVTWSAADADDATSVFDALAEGGEVTQELIPTFFSPAFGMVTDRFGTPWMVSAAAPEDAG
jgi:PhnB protein